MSGCMHMDPYDWCLSCASEKAKLWKERAERAEAELDLRKRLMHGLPICGGCMGKYTECQACRAEKAERERDEAIRKLGVAIGYREGHPDMCCGKCSDLLAEAREDIKALATVIIADNAGADWPVWATERVRDRKLLEVSDGAS